MNGSFQVNIILKLCTVLFSMLTISLPTKVGSEYLEIMM